MNPFADAHDQADVVLNYEHPAFEILADLSNARPQRIPLTLVEAGGRLIEQQKAWSGGEGTCDPESALITVW